MFDGPDGSGKTTQIALAKGALESLGHTVFVTRSHGGTPLGEELRKVSFMAIERQPLTDYYISLAMHSELQADIHHHRTQGHIVLLDRSPLSIWAYQVYASGLEAEFAADGIDHDMQQFNPDLIICYHATLATLRKRMAMDTHKADYFESKPDDYFERVIEGYQFAADRYGAQQIGAEQSIEAVHAATMRPIVAMLSQTK